jgi:hypothetical protein
MKQTGGLAGGPSSGAAALKSRARKKKGRPKAAPREIRLLFGGLLQIDVCGRTGFRHGLSVRTK